MAEHRANLHVRLSEEARAGWERACLRYGITLSAYIESIGIELARNDVRTDQGMDVIERARQIDLDRRSRR